MSPEPRDSGPAPEVFSPENLSCMDDTVREVFRVQLGIDIVACTPPTAPEKKNARSVEQTALIGFAGIISGLCEIRLSVPASLAIARAMLPAAHVEEGSDAVCDAVGELCNLLAGGWKNRLPELGADCSLTIPTVIAGEVYQVRRPANVLVTRRTYTFGGGHQLFLTLVYNPG